MPLVQKILFYSISAIILILILVLVRKKRIREIDSWLWLLFAFFLIIIISNIAILEKLSSYLQVAKSVVIIFLSTIAFLIFILQLYMTCANYHTKIKNLSQKIALLEEKVERLQENTAGKQQDAPNEDTNKTPEKPLDKNN
jgi:hypothetical protein